MVKFDPVNANRACKFVIYIAYRCLFTQDNCPISMIAASMCCISYRLQYGIFCGYAINCCNSMPFTLPNNTALTHVISNPVDNAVLCKQRM